MKRIHRIKLEEVFCNAVLCGDKNFEIRYNDRGYQKGDLVKFIPVRDGITMAHSITKTTFEITYVMSGWGIESGYVVFGIRPIK